MKGWKRSMWSEQTGLPRCPRSLKIRSLYEMADRNASPFVAYGVETLQTLYRLYPDRFDLDKIWHVTRSRGLIEHIKNQVPIKVIVKSWKTQFTKFLDERRKYLHYE